MLVAVFIAAMVSLAACENEGETSKSGPGSIKLTLNFPAFTGEEAITKLSATLEKADGAGAPVTLDKTAEHFSDVQQPGYNTTTLAFDSVPSGQYILTLIFYRGDAVAAFCTEVVTVQPGEESNKWQADDGGTYSVRTFMPKEFRSMAVAAFFILKNSDGTMVPLSQTNPIPTSWKLDKSRVTDGIGMQLEIALAGGLGTSLVAVTLNEEDILSLFTSTNGNSAIPVYTGTFDIGTGEALIYVEVQAPDRETTVSYTISQSP
jgi:hypothetical protein